MSGRDVWETPRNLAILVVATAVVASLVFGFLGFEIARTPAPPPVIINLPPQK